MWKAEIEVMLKESVLDPQGQAVKNALKSLGYDIVQNVRIGKYQEVTVDAKDKAEAEAVIKEMCEKLLANTVIEEYTFTVTEV